jgi:hypothetical protein
MKDKLSVTHADFSTKPHTRRNPVDGAACWARRASRFQLTHPPVQGAWLAHGSGRAFHMAPHSPHVSRAPKGS